MTTAPKLLILGPAAYRTALDHYLRSVKRSPPWYMRLFGILPRGFLYNGTVVILRGNEKNERLVAHEYGHWLGYRHPPIASLAYWVDTMGYGLRITDDHDVVERSASWRRSVGL